MGDECEYNEEWKRVKDVQDVEMMKDVVDEVKVDERAVETQEVKK